MMNRIALLEQEEEKIRRKIEMTKKKATEITQTKEHNEKRYVEKLQMEDDMQK